MNEGMSQILPILHQKLVSMEMSFEGSQVICHVIKHFHTPTNPENLVKIGSVHSEIRGVRSWPLKQNYRKNIGKSMITPLASLLNIRSLR